MMKKDVRTSQGTAWSTATDTAQSNLASAIKDYESAMGSGETVEVGGEETEAIGTVQAGLDSALDALVTAEGALRTGVGSINEALKQERTSFVNSLQVAKTNFSSSVSDAYLTPNIDTYIVDADQIITDTETGINTHLFGEGAGDFNTAKWNEFGYNPAATTDMATDSSVAGDVGGEKWSGLGWMTAGIILPAASVWALS